MKRYFVKLISSIGGKSSAIFPQKLYILKVILIPHDDISAEKFP